MFQATRRRLALWYATVTAVVLVLFAASIYLYVRMTLIERVDDTLKHVIEVVERSLVSEAAEQDEETAIAMNLAASLRRSATARNLNEDRIDLEWFSPTGQLLWTTWESGLDLPLEFNPRGRTVFLAASAIASQESPSRQPLRQPLRQITQLIQRDRQPLGYLRVSHPWFEVTQPSQDLIVDLVCGISCMVMAIGAIGWWLSGIAMRPVLDSYERLRQFTADASHELRSPIASIQTNVQVALHDPGLSTPRSNAAMSVRDRLSVVERTTRRLGQLVDDLLFLARHDSAVDTVEWETIPLDALLLETVEEQRAIATAKSLTLHLDIQDIQPIPELPTLEDHRSDAHLNNQNDQNADNGDAPYSITGNWSQLARLFTNLLSNAIRYTPPQGQVQVTLYDRRDRLEGGDRHIIVDIRDTGIGIAPEDLTHVFDRFYRVETSRQRPTDGDEGSGLGLAIAQAIADRHAARLTLTSQRGQGTTATTIFKARSLPRRS